MGELSDTLILACSCSFLIPSPPRSPQSQTVVSSDRKLLFPHHTSDQWPVARCSLSIVGVLRSPRGSTASCGLNIGLFVSQRFISTRRGTRNGGRWLGPVFRRTMRQFDRVDCPLNPTVSAPLVPLGGSPCGSVGIKIARTDHLGLQCPSPGGERSPMPSITVL